MTHLFPVFVAVTNVAAFQTQGRAWKATPDEPDPDWQPL
jgi:hypothetical protein